MKLKHTYRHVWAVYFHFYITVYCDHHGNSYFPNTTTTVPDKCHNIWQNHVLLNPLQGNKFVCRRYYVFHSHLVLFYSIHVPWWLLKWLNLITAHGSVSNEPGSVTWLATSWRNNTEELTTLWPENISFWPKINTPSSYFTILMLNCLESTLKLQFDSYVTAVKFLIFKRTCWLYLIPTQLESV